MKIIKMTNGIARPKRPIFDISPCKTGVYALGALWRFLGRAQWVHNPTQNMGLGMERAYRAEGVSHLTESGGSARRKPMLASSVKYALEYVGIGPQGIKRDGGEGIVDRCEMGRRARNVGHRNHG